MSNLRAKVEGLPWVDPELASARDDLVMRANVLRLIPEGAVLVTEAQLLAACQHVGGVDPSDPHGWDDFASEVLARLRETP